VHHDEDRRWLAVTKGPLTVACNLGPQEVTVRVPPGEMVLASDSAATLDGDRAVLPAESVIVITIS
jgi:maltooligosyltrehalose trehalohydrolase